MNLKVYFLRRIFVDESDKIFIRKNIKTTWNLSICITFQSITLVQQNWLAKKKSSSSERNNWIDLKLSTFPAKIYFSFVDKSGTSVWNGISDFTSYQSFLFQGSPRSIHCLIFWLLLLFFQTFHIKCLRQRYKIVVF